MTNSNRSKVLGIIPARYASTRFPGKPLAPLGGKTLIWQTYSNARDCASLDALVVATDDQRIFDHVKGFGGQVIMTSPDCLNGTDRAVEVIGTADFSDYDIIINIQGDEPRAPIDLLDRVVGELQGNPDAVMVTAVIPICAEEGRDPSRVKCVVDQKGRALYFSRAMIPATKSGKLPEGVYQHLGIYAYRKEFLLQLIDLPVTPLQMIEDLEQLKVLEHGFPIHVVVGTNAIHGVDTPEDLKRVEELLCEQNLSLSPAGWSHH
jgi:3-deoxy-manno-octulosonate cytidylyltransferase (CMP-KDO synthetase)